MFANKFKNADDPNDRSPHFKGHININGQEKDISAWWAWPQNGGDAYLRVKVSEPKQKEQAYPTQPSRHAYAAPTPAMAQAPAPAPTDEPKGQDDLPLF